jgi:hypothetical protein
MFLCAAVLAVLLVIGGVEQNPGPDVEAENSLQVFNQHSKRTWIFLINKLHDAHIWSWIQSLRL